MTTREAMERAEVADMNGEYSRAACWYYLAAKCAKKPKTRSILRSMAKEIWSGEINH